MAYVPDDAMSQKGPLTPSAWSVYEALCSLAKTDTGIVLASYFINSGETELFYLKLVERTGGLAIGTIKNALSELRIGRKDSNGKIVHEGGWVGLRGGRLCLLVGTFLSKLRKPNTATPINYSPSPHDDSASPISDASSPVSDSAYIGSRARSYQPTNQPRNQHTHTSPPAPLGDQPSQGAGGCVSDEISLQDFWDYAASPEGKSLNSPASWVNKGFDKPVAMDTVRRWKERQRPEVLAKVRAQIEESGLSYYQAAPAVQGMVAKGTNAQAAIDSLRISPDVRARLVEKFCQEKSQELEVADGAENAQEPEFQPAAITA